MLISLYLCSYKIKNIYDFIPYYNIIITYYNIIYKEFRN